MVRKSKGFTLVELIAVIAVLSLISLIAIPEVIKVINKAEKETFESHIRSVVRATNYEFKRLQMEGLTEFETVFTFENGVESSNVKGAKLEYEGQKIENGVIKIKDDGKVALAIYNEKWCAIKMFNSNDIIVTKITSPLNCEVQQPVDISGANRPQLVTGMTPVVWNGNEWVQPTNIDDPYYQDWYDYANKKWANARTEDGSMWFWIPRYAYKISTGYHSNTPGTIEVKFLKGKTNEAADGTSIETEGYEFGVKDTSMYYFKHPAFTFGDEELTGFWVAKFEPSVSDQNDACYTTPSTNNCNKTTLIPKIIPNAKSWVYIAVGNAFDVALNMKNQNVYGWNFKEIDTHMMNNIEWGAVAYLSKSVYGANDEIWINNNKKSITGCAGNSVSADEYSGCQNTYESANGQKASTTHNIYGVYDMSGGTWEYVAAYVNNNSSGYLTMYGQSILNAESKYKNVYASLVDSQSNNYQNNKNTFGDAVYETSSCGDGSCSWYGDYSKMPYAAEPWFIRGGGYDSDVKAGVFLFQL